MKSDYYSNLNEIVDELQEDNKEVKIIKLPRKNGPRKMLMHKGKVKRYFYKK